ncbi:MAG TPA: hypothetical protein ENG13_00305 [bacterium]|nr:hypothetical protein [bacterium]HEX67495.1 hypothetical protein [bacterium]
MSKEVKIVCVIAVVAFLLGIAGTTISIINNHLIRTRVIKPARFLAMKKALAPLLKERRGLRGKRELLWQGRLRPHPGHLPPQQTPRERLRELAKKKGERREIMLKEAMRRIRGEMAEQRKMIEELSRKLEELEEKVK